MKKFLALISALALAVLCCITAFADSETVVIDMDTTYQTIDGFGASYTWYGDWLTTNIHAEEGYDWIFNETEFNILRFRDLNHVGDEYQNALNGYPAYYAYYKAAIDRGIDPIVLVTSWGQYDRNLEWVAFTEKSAAGYSYYTLAKDSNGEYMYDELAKFCVESIRYFYDAGIDVDYFSISNEIELQERHVDENGKAREEAGFFFGAEETDDYCCYWKAHIAVYEAFQEAFGEYAPVLLGAETMAGYPDLLGRYLDPVIENCPESLEIVGHHLYGTDLSERNLRAVGEAFSDYPIWQTEWYNSDFFGHAEVVLDELVYEGVSAYLYWNGVWIADLGNCIIEIGGANETADIQRIGNHYIMQHFSKFIKNGYRRVDVKDELGTKFGAFKSPDESKLVVVAMNPTENAEYMNLDIGGKTILGSQVWMSIEGANRFSHDYLLDKGAYDGELELPARSLTTIVFDLEPNANYVEPAAEERVNPYVNTKVGESEKVSSAMIGGLIAAAAAVVIAIIAAAVIAAAKTRKLVNDDAAETAEDNKEE